jgi:oligosaccharyltransferase complex subunit epsilon
VAILISDQIAITNSPGMAPRKTTKSDAPSTVSSAPCSKPPVTHSSSPNQLSFSLSSLSNATAELWNSYRAKTPNSLIMIDAFLVFLVYVGAVQFVYACLTGGYPFNSFLAGFAAAVGQFVLTGPTPRSELFAFRGTS